MVQEKSSWWSRRTTLEKRLTVICSLFALVLVAFLIAIIVVSVNNNSGGNSENICLTQACIEESATVLVQMNQNADPCNDFYEFACGTFLEETVIPDDKTTVTAFSVIENELKEHLRIIVQEPIQENEIAPFQNVKRLYRACLNTSLIEQLGVTPVTNIINSWPVIVGDGWSENEWTWQQSVANSGSNGYSVSYFISFSVSTDSRDTTKRIIRIDQASLGLSREYLIENLTEPFVQAYHDYQVDLAILFGATDENRARQEMKDVLDFEIELAEISLAREDRRDAEKLYNPMTVEQLQTTYIYEGHDWLSYFNNILSTESQLTSDDTIVVGAITFFEQLGALLQRTSKRTLANYVAWREAVASVDYLPNNFRIRQLEYDRITSGREVATARWLECVDTTLSYYPLAFGALYVRKHFRAEAKEKALEMVNNIRNEFKEMLTENEWMDEETKTGANEKINSITEQIGFADELLDDAKLTEYYDLAPAVVNENEYYQSSVRLNAASGIRSRGRLREPVDKEEWSTQVAPAIVNAFYSSLENSIKFPAGILQGAFFNAERPQYMNYGGIGFVIGHEITHGFDDQGSQYDGQGNLRNWWANATREAYLAKAQCIIDQYDNYLEPLTQLNVNGINTQGENIADNGGIKESYRAYNRWAANNPESKMPGLDYTPQQMFWISAGQVWCGLYREEAMKNRVTTGVHSPGQFRVIGPMSNMKEFSDDFQCAVGTPMNPVSKCEVW